MGMMTPQERARALRPLIEKASASLNDTDALIGISTARYNRSAVVDVERENEELRDTISLSDTFEVFDHKGAE